MGKKYNYNGENASFTFVDGVLTYTDTHRNVRFTYTSNAPGVAIETIASYEGVAMSAIQVAKAKERFLKQAVAQYEALTK